MKNYRLLTLLILLFTISLTTSKCKKNKTPANPDEQLPPETQSGSNTFGCLVDGKVFLPKRPFGALNPVLTCYYEYIYYPSPVGYVFQVSASDNSSPSLPINLNILFDSSKIMVNKYFLQNGNKGYARGNYRKFTNNVLDDYYTFSQSSGELNIKKFDEINQIISGTFWFNAVNALGDTVHVTDGRFDMQYTK
ncbi:MAG: DUF6252 family protein [Ferruginibacter sp.]